MARKAAKQDITDVTLNDAALADASTALTTLGEIQRQATENAQALAVSFNYTGELSAPALEDEIRFYQRRTAEACLELGKRLVLLREMTPHGQFAARIEGLGLGYRMANRFMGAAVKFSKCDSKSLLTAAATQTKVLELATLDDEEIEALNEGNTVRGITLDTVAQMGVTELRNKLREAEADKAAKDKLLADYGSKITEQNELIARKFKPKDGSIATTTEEATFLNGLNEHVNGAEVHFARLGVVVAELMASGPREAIRERAQQTIQYLVSRMREIVLENQLEVNVESDALGGRPEWLNAIN